MSANESSWDRIIRVVIGLALGVLGFFPDGWRPLGDHSRRHRSGAAGHRRDRLLPDLQPRRSQHQEVITVTRICQ